MSFTQYKWGVSKPYRNTWGITGFSSLRTDYARIVQINNFLLKIVLFLVKRVRSFDKYMNFSHLLIKNYSLSFYDRPFFSVEMFFWIKTLEDSFIKKKNKKKFKFKKFKFKRRVKFKKKDKLVKVKNKRLILIDKGYSLNKFLKLPSLVIVKRFTFKKRSKKVKTLKKNHKYLKSLTHLNFTRGINRYINEKLKKRSKKVKTLKKKTKVKTF